MVFVFVFATFLQRNRLPLIIHFDDRVAAGGTYAASHDLPDFASIWRDWRGGEDAEIHNEHLGAAEAYVYRLVEAVGLKDNALLVRGVSDEIAHLPGLPVNAGYFKSGQARRPGSCRDGAGLGNKDVALEAESLGAGEVKHISRGVQLNFCEGRFDLQVRPKLVRKGELRAGRLEYGRRWRREWERFGTEFRIRHRKWLAGGRIVKEIRMSKELDTVADTDHEHVIKVVVDRPGSTNRNHPIDGRLAHVRAVVADKQPVGIERIKANPIRIAKAPSLQPHRGGRVCGLRIKRIHRAAAGDDPLNRIGGRGGLHNCPGGNRTATKGHERFGDLRRGRPPCGVERRKRNQRLVPVAAQLDIHTREILECRGA